MTKNPRSTRATARHWRQGGGRQGGSAEGGDGIGATARGRSRRTVAALVAWAAGEARRSGEGQDSAWLVARMAAKEAILFLEAIIETGEEGFTIYTFITNIYLR